MLATLLFLFAYLGLLNVLLGLMERNRVLELSPARQSVEKSSNVCSSCREYQAHAFADSDELCDGCMIHGVLVRDWGAIPPGAVYEGMDPRIMIIEPAPVTEYVSNRVSDCACADIAAYVPNRALSSAHS